MNFLKRVFGQGCDTGSLGPASAPMGTTIKYAYFVERLMNMTGD